MYKDWFTNFPALFSLFLVSFHTLLKKFQLVKGLRLDLIIFPALFSSFLVTSLRSFKLLFANRLSSELIHVLCYFLRYFQISFTNKIKVELIKFLALFYFPVSGILFLASFQSIWLNKNEPIGWFHIRKINFIKCLLSLQIIWFLLALDFTIKENFQILDILLFIFVVEGYKWLEIIL